MSESDHPDTVGPEPRFRPNAEMGGIGWAIFLGLVVVLLPLLPFLVAIWGIGKLLDRSRVGGTAR